MFKGLPFALSFLAILGAHELGHYFAARHHRVAVTLPYFLPFPSIWGTLGAFIQLRSPTKNQKQLFDVGIAGPLAGLAIAVPLLFWGLSLSELKPLPTTEDYMLEGNSLFYAWAKYTVFGQMLPNAQGLDVFLHPMAWAAWSGLFVTVLNLLPVGQLDGGHVIYVLFGYRARLISMLTLAIMAVVGAFYWQGWLFWVLLISLVVGIGHPPPLNEITPLDGRRKFLGYAMLGVFMLLFVPTPLELITV